VLTLSLCVPDNRLTEFPRHIVHLTTLHEVNLASNLIKAIPRDFLFSNMANAIRSLHLQNNFLVQARVVVQHCLVPSCASCSRVPRAEVAVRVGSCARGLLPQLPLGVHWMSSIVDLRLENNPFLRSPPQSVRRLPQSPTNRILDARVPCLRPAVTVVRTCVSCRSRSAACRTSWPSALSDLRTFVSWWSSRSSIRLCIRADALFTCAGVHGDSSVECVG
jgi:hypothetical protein